MNEVPSVYIYNGVDRVPNNVTHVRVDPSVTVIPEETFMNCRQLIEVELPEGLVRIEDDAFFSCQSLIRINFPSTLEEIGNSTFNNCNKLDVITLPEGLQQLGWCAFCRCTSLKTINIPANIESIKQSSFSNCEGLANVSFPEGLRLIEQSAFNRCKSLVSVTLPSSLSVIAKEAFSECPLLNKIRLPDALETIQSRAFSYCSIAHFRIPPSPSNGYSVDLSIVGSNASLVSLELPEAVQRLNDNYNSTEEDHTDLNVRNIALTSVCEIHTPTLYYCTDLKLALLDTERENIFDIAEGLRHRFDDLPIHKLCYYQSYHDTETAMQSLKREINPWTSKPPGQLNTTGKEQDCLGMTPLHILACSTKQNVEMYRLLIDKYPESLIMKDKWGGVPLLYAIWCNAPAEVVDLLVESYKSIHPDYEFDWKGMLKTLAKRDVPLANLQRLVDAQLNSFPEQTYDMQSVVMELASSDSTQARSTRGYYKPHTSIETFRYLLRLSISDRLDMLDVERFQVDLENDINVLLKMNTTYRDTKTQAVYTKLVTYESIKEGTSILELALWKAKIDESRNKRARVGGEVDYRGQCRINSGEDIVIRNVMPYLLPE